MMIKHQHQESKQKRLSQNIRKGVFKSGGGV